MIGLFQRLKWIVLALFGAGSLAACQTFEPDGPAVLVSDDDANMAALKAGLADAMGRANIELGAGDPTMTPLITVLPPALGPHETRSPATPTQFVLELRNGVCTLFQVETNERFPVPAVQCRAVQNEPL